MKFPEFAIRGVESMAQSVAQPGLTAGKVITEQSAKAAEGMQAYADELAKTQQLRAEAKLSAGLAATEKELESRQYFTKREVVQALGEIPAEYAAMLESKKDDEMIPTWMVGEAIYAKKAEQVRADARREVGWDSRRVRDFDARSSAVVQGRGVDLRKKYLRDQHDFQVASQLTAFQTKLDNARASVDFEAVREDIRGSRVLGMDEKEKLLKEVGAREDTTPIYKALQRGDVLDLAKERSALADPEQKRNLTPQQRQAYTQTIDAFLAHAKRAEQGPSPEDIAKANTETKLRELAIFTAQFESERRTNPNVVREMLKKDTMGRLVTRFVPPSLEMTGGGREHILGVLKSLTDPDTYRAKEGSERKSDFLVFEALNRIAGTDPDSFKTGVFDLSAVIPGAKEKLSLDDLRRSGHLNDSDARKFSDLTRSLAGAKDPKLAKPYQLAMEDRRLAHSAAADYGINPDAKDAKTRRMVGELEKVAGTAIQEATPPGGELTLDQKTIIAKEAVARVVRSRPGMLYGTNVSAPLLDAGLDGAAASAVAKSMERARIPAEKHADFAKAFAGDYRAASDAAEQARKMAPKLSRRAIGAEDVAGLAEALRDVRVTAKLDADVVSFLTRRAGADEAAKWMSGSDPEKAVLRATVWLSK